MSAAAPTSAALTPDAPPDVGVVLLAEGQHSGAEVSRCLYRFRDRHVRLVGQASSIAECLDLIGGGRAHVVLVHRAVDRERLGQRVLDAIRKKGQCGLVGLVDAGDEQGAAEFRAWHVDEVVEGPFDPPDERAALRLVDAIRVADVLRFQSEKAGSRVVVTRKEVDHYPDRTFAIWSPAGGVGKTTVARELAVATACYGGHATQLLDLCATGPVMADLWMDEAAWVAHCARVAYPTITALMRELGPGASGDQLAEAAQRARWNYPVPVKAAQVSPGRSSLDVVFGPWKENEYLAFDAGVLRADGGAREPREVWARPIRALKRLAKWSFFDCGQDLSMAVHQAALEEADVVLIVTTPSAPTVRLVAKYIADLRALVGDPARVKVVLNRVEPDVGLSREEVHEALDRTDIIGALPLATAEIETARLHREPAMLRYLQGEPTPFTTALARLVHGKIAPLPEIRTARSWWRWPRREGAS